jgi:hypothetical protein
MPKEKRGNGCEEPSSAARYALKMGTAKAATRADRLKEKLDSLARLQRPDDEH